MFGVDGKEIITQVKVGFYLPKLYFSIEPEIYRQYLLNTRIKALKQTVHTSFLTIQNKTTTREHNSKS